MDNKNKKIIYLDYAATTPLDLEVKREMDLVWEKYGNPSSLHSKGYEAKVALDSAREKIAKILGSRIDEVIFTSGGTESDNLAIFGYARANKSKGNHIIVSAIEHHAVLEPAHQLEKEGFDVTYLPVSKDGIIDLEVFKKSLRPETILVSIMYANNEIGTIQPISAIAEVISKWKLEIKKEKLPITNYQLPVLHSDACQAAGFLDLNIKNLGVDMMTINAGKIYGPKGVGILYVKKGLQIEPMIYGGGQEFGLRAGTENVAAIAGLANALEMAQQLKEKESKRLLELRNYLINRILKEIPKTRLNGSRENRLPNNMNISFLAIEGESLILYLDQAGICASTGSACTSKNLEPSHVILALGEPHEVAHSSLRLTLGRDTTKEDLDYVMKVLPEIVSKLRKMSPLR